MQRQAEREIGGRRADPRHQSAASAPIDAGSIDTPDDRLREEGAEPAGVLLIVQAEKGSAAVACVIA